MENSRYVVAIDLGESNVVVAVGTLSEGGVVTVNCIASRPCDGVKNGMIDNIALVEESLKIAITDVETNVGIRIVEAYAGISGEFVRLACHSDHVYVSQPQNGVSVSDVEALFDRMRHVQAPDNEIIMERIPQNYIVDDEKEVKNPVGSFGRKLLSTFNFILCGNTPMQRLQSALSRVGVRMVNSFPNALSVADSVLTPDEKEEGVAVVNIGAGLTDVTIYYRNVVRYTISIPMGASAINADIRSMMIPDKFVEQLKCEYGSAVADMVPDNKMVSINGRTPRESKNILIYNLAVAIEARVAMLIEFIKREISDSGYEDKLPYGIVITGGCANLKNIDELFRRMTNMEIRIGTPIEGITEESINKFDNSSYATAVGILVRGGRLGECRVIKTHKPLDGDTPVFPPKVEEKLPPKVPGGGTTPPPPSTGGGTPPPPPPSPVGGEVPKPPVKEKKKEDDLPPTPPPCVPEPHEPPVPPVVPPPTKGDKELPPPPPPIKEPIEDEEIRRRGGLGFNMKNAVKSVFDKLNKGFDAADEEEI